MTIPAPSPSPSLVRARIASVATRLETLQEQLPSIRYGQAPAEHAAQAASTVVNDANEALIGYVAVRAGEVDFSDGVWSDRAGQSQTAQGARLLARTTSGLEQFAAELARVAVSTQDVGQVPVYNKFGNDPGTPLAAYFGPALDRARGDLAAAIVALDAG